MDIITFGEKYGWLVAIGIYTAKWFFDKGWPQMVKWFNKEADAKHKEAEVKQKQEAEERERRARYEDDERANRRKRDDEDRIWQRQMTERTVAAQEATAQKMTEIALRLASMQRTVEASGEGITTLLARTDYLSSFSNTGKSEGGKQ